MGLISSLGFGGAGSPVRSIKPPGGSTNQGGVAAIFGETNPSNATDTPRVAGNIPARGDPVTTAPKAVLYGSFGNDPAQTAGMSVLWVDQINPMPSQGVQGLVKSAIGQSAYAPWVHYRLSNWLNAGWDPIFRFANTAMDMRWRAGTTQPVTNEQPLNMPGATRMGPPYAPGRAAQYVPRFSSEPYTIIPQASPK